MLIIQHAEIMSPEARSIISDGSVLIVNGQIQAIGLDRDLHAPASAQCLDAEGRFLLPGFIDLQLNGAFGADFTDDPDTIWKAGEGLPQYGVTAFLPTVITSPLETARAAQAVLKKPPSGYRGAVPLGLHLEGPFLNPNKKGAHNQRHLRPPDLESIAGWSPGEGVRLVTLAPELPGAEAVIRELKRRGVVVSAGHTTASFEQAQIAFQQGVSCGTHLYNAMPTLEHRNPGLTGALLVTPGIAAGLIVDGLHAHPGMVDLTWRIKGPGDLILVTDAMAALGMPPGRYMLGDFEVIVDGASARLADGTLAGSILTMDTALRNLLAYTGCNLEQALPTLTSNPARLLALPERGKIAPGYVADLVLMDADLTVAACYVSGQCVYTK